MSFVPFVSSCLPPLRTALRRTSRGGRRHTAAGASIAAAAAIAVTLAAQQQPPRPPTFRTEANLVRVDIHVLKNGGPVADLDEDDFEVYEDTVRQKIASLEFVRVETPGTRIPIEPSSTAAAMDLARDPNNRVFILFLDTYHVTPENSLQTGMALVRMLDTLVGPNDLIGLMTPEMEIRDLILARKTDVLRNGLLQNRRWGRLIENCRPRGNLDEIENTYAICYPCVEPACDPTKCDLSPTALALIRRRRESFTLGVLSDLVRYIGATREARTAFIMVTEGWHLFTPRDDLANAGAAAPPQIRIGPGGRLGTQNPGDFNVDQDACARHLRQVAQIDHDRRFRELIDDANRNNASFYVVDAGGLRTGAPSIDPLPGQLPPRGFVDTLRTLADNTDGNAIVNTNDIKGGLLRVVDDLSGYYLLGYYSTNTRSDGSYRTIRVKVNRPGVEVRSRKGYRAWTAADVKAMNAARVASTSAAAPDPAVTAHTTALGRLSRLKPDTQLFVHASLDAVRSELHVVGELAAAAAKTADWRQGGDAQILVTGPDGSPAASGKATIAPGGRAFLARLPLSGKATGAYEVGVRLKSAAGATVVETIQAQRTADPLGEPLAFRAKQDPVATFLWWRTEQIRFEAPLTADATLPAGRLLDRAGNPMPVPVDVTIRDDAGGRWAVAIFKLAPLSPGDYVLELTSGQGRRLVALRVDR